VSQSLYDIFSINQRSVIIHSNKNELKIEPGELGGGGLFVVISDEPESRRSQLLKQQSRQFEANAEIDYDYTNGNCREVV
jgi:hypothetical protein